VDDQIHLHKYKFLLVSAFSSFIGTLDASIVNVSLPTLSRAFSVPVDVVAWVVLGYALTIAATLLVVGRLSAQRGYRFVYVIGFSLFTLGSLLCALSASIWQLIGFRVIQGIGASFLMASGPALITRAFPATERGRSMGMLGTIVGIGLMAGPPLGGLLVTTVGWRSIFLINIPIGIAAIIYTAKLLKIVSPDHPDAKVNYLSGFYQGGGIIFLLLFLNRLNSPGWSHQSLYAVLALSLALLAAFLWRETHTDYPLLGLSIFTYRQFTLAISVMMITFICTSSNMVLMPFYLEGILGLLPSQVGLVLVTVPLITAMVAPISGRLSDAIGYRLLTTCGLSVLTVGLLWIGTLGQHSTRLDVVMRLIVVGIGAGIFQAPNSSAMMSAVPRQLVGVASGLLSVARNIGITGGVAVATAAFSFRHSVYAESMAPNEAFVKAFSWVITAFAFVALAAVFLSAIRDNRAVKRIPPEEKATSEMG